MREIIRYIKRHKLRATIGATLVYWLLWWALVRTFDAAWTWSDIVMVSYWNFFIVLLIYYEPRDQPEFVYLDIAHSDAVVTHLRQLGFSDAVKEGDKRVCRKRRGWMATEKVTLRSVQGVLEVHGKVRYLEPLYPLRLKYKQLDRTTSQA
ncbi:MAG: hypothetical protein R3330_08665 [Saprospiraceae bacterium]|nr:hypothetical protein [Saprospiraceae bacterium]